MQLTVKDAQNIVDVHFPDMKAVNASWIPNTGLSFTAGTMTYIIDLKSQSESSVETHSSFLVLRDEAMPHTGNGPEVISKVLQLVKSNTAIPILLSALGTATIDGRSFQYLVTAPYGVTSSSLIKLSDARKRELLDTQSIAQVELQIGQFLAQLHQGIQNDWYGEITLLDPVEPSYSWSETFHLQFETLLSEVEALGMKDSELVGSIEFSRLRQYFARAVGSYMFDDVDVPSLVWFTGSEHDIYIALPSESKPSVGIAAILPNLPHAVWGDPLLETFFTPEHLTPAMQEGYSSAGGEPLLVYPRQHSKRLWYTVVLAFTVLKEVLGRGENERQSWAMNTIRQSIAALGVVHG